MTASTTQTNGPLLLKDEEVATLLTVTSETIRNLHRSGVLKGVLVGRHLRWRPAAVEKYVAGLAQDG